MSREVCGHVYDDFICGMAKSYGDHDPDVREFGGHEYEPVLVVPLPLDYALAAQVIDVPSWAANENWWDVAQRVVDAALGRV